MFPSITFELVRESIKKRWERIEKHTRFKFDKFIKGIEFLMNSIYFRFNNKFYKQLNGTPIGSVISPILAEIVFDDLEHSILREYNLLFYFRYVDDTILCVPTE